MFIDELAANEASYDATVNWHVRMRKEWVELLALKYKISVQSWGNLGSLPLTNMKCLFSLVVLCNTVAILCADSSESQDIDWDEAVHFMISLFEKEYGADDMKRLAKDVYAEDFIYISPNSIIFGDFGELADHFEARRNLGYFLAGQVDIISSCGDTALAWGTLVFTDGGNQSHEGSITGSLRYIDGKAKIQFVHYTV